MKKPGSLTTCSKCSKEISIEEHDKYNYMCERCYVKGEFDDLMDEIKQVVWIKINNLIK